MITIPIIITIIFITIFIFKNRKQGIIMHIGFFKVIIFSVGILLFFISNYFITYENYIECSLNLFFKHIGIVTVISIFYIIIGFNIELGAKFDMNDENNIKNAKNKSLLFSDEDFVTSEIIIKSSKRYSTENVNESSLNNLEDNTYSGDVKKKKDHSNLEKIIFKSLIENKLKNERSFNFSNTIKNLYKPESNIMKSANDIEITSNSLNRLEKQNQIFEKNIRATHSLFILVIITYIMVSLIIILMIIYEIKNINQIYLTNEASDNIIQNINGEWSYKCPLEDFDLSLNSIEFIFFIIILLKGRHIYNYCFIFQCTHQITYSSGVAVIMGPLINVTII